MRNATKKIWISVLNQAYIHANLVEVLMFLDRHSPYELKFEFPSNKPGVHNRSMIVERFLESDFDYLMMIDCGVVPPQNILNLVTCDVPIVSPLVHAFQNVGIVPLALKEPKPHKDEDEDFLSRAMGITPTLTCEKELKYGVMGESEGEKINEGLVEVDATGTGCLLIKRQVLEDLKPAFWDIFDPETGKRIMGQDLNFCYRAKELGYKTYVHFGYRASHITPMDMKIVHEATTEAGNEVAQVKKQYTI